MAETVPAWPVLQKTVAEVKSITFDFTPELAASGTTLTGSPTLTAEAGLTVGAGTIDTTGKFVTAQVSGGALGVWYLVDCRCAGTDGQVHEIACVVEIAPVN